MIEEVSQPTPKFQCASVWEIELCKSIKMYEIEYPVNMDECACALIMSSVSSVSAAHIHFKLEFD